MIETIKDVGNTTNESKMISFPCIPLYLVYVLINKSLVTKVLSFPETAITPGASVAIFYMYNVCALVD